MSISVLLVEDHHLVRKGLSLLLEQEEDLDIIGETGSGLEAVELAERLTPRVVLMDVTLSDLNGIDATRRITERVVGTRVIILTSHNSQDVASGAFNAGAAGYIVKGSAIVDLVAAIHQVAAGQRYVSPHAAASLGRFGNGASAATATSGAFTRLTTRERQVLQLLADGKSTKEAAYSLGVSVKTAETHRRSVMAKVDLDSIADLTKYALREGITSL